MNEKKCFIIQPLDEVYKTRCDKTYKPAIEKAGLYPYRVDEHYDAKTLIIQKIREEIEDSQVCLAEITENNPNVWYEFGFADGCGVPVVLICEDGKRESLPFDVNQRNVCFYKTDSQGDWEELQQEITRRLQIAIQNPPAKKTEIGVVEIEDKDSVQFGAAELCLLKILYYDSKGYAEKNVIEGKMKNLGFHSMDIIDAFNRLEVEKVTKPDFYLDYTLSEEGRKWCVANKELLRQAGQ